MINTKYIKKNNYTCQCCKDTKYNKESFEYTTYITKKIKLICTKCFSQQFGKKNANNIKEEYEKK